MQLIYLVLICCSLAAALKDEEIKQEWLKFKLNKGKSYRNILEVNKRYMKFKKNLELIVEHNELYKHGKVSYEMGLNEYSDMDFKEIESTLMGIKVNGSNQENFPNGEIFVPSLPIRNLPASLDWRHSGAVTKVKNQESCGSCWAFSATGALESHHFLKTKNTVLLSEQNLVDCESKSHGCSGGHTYLAFEYISRNDGINTEQSYPYKAKQGKCNFKRKHVGATCKGYVQLPYGQEDALLEAVATVGPISVYIDASYAFVSYKKGVFDDISCTKNINHAVLVVGYGSEDGRDYWLVKNSWGTSWGEKGYIKMSRNKNNQCGIGTWSYYPKV